MGAGSDHDLGGWIFLAALWAFVPRVASPLYWILLCLLIALGVWVPYKLVTWVPEVMTLRQQAWSAGLRFAAAYFILISAFILLVWMVGERTDREDPIE